MQYAPDYQHGQNPNAIPYNQHHQQQPQQFGNYGGYQQIPQIPVQ
jgi:hypothetical protein